MKKKIMALLISLALVLSVSNPAFAAVQKTDVQGTLAAEFASPPNTAKTQTRFWVPDAAIDEQTMREDLREIAALGFGGVEVVSYTQFIFGIPAEYNWGTKNWEKAMEIIVDECEKLGLEVSVTNGPSWPVSMPTVEGPDDEGSSYEMTYGVVTVEAGQTYSGVVPERTTVRDAGTPHLIAVGAYQLTAEKTIDFGTYVDLYGQVAINKEDNAQSTISWTAPTDGSYVLFSFWEQPTAQTTSNGFYVVDHYGRAGAQACIDYWEEAISAYDYMDYVTAIFEDSLEVHSDKEWTRGFQNIFEERKGYDITPYMPAIGGGNLYQTGEGPNYAFTDTKLTQQIKNDYNDVVTYCYIEYHLKPLQKLAADNGMALRAQVAYNKPMDTVTSALYVDIPETEGLNRNTIDFFRQMAAAVHMTDKNILSFEGASEFIGVYSQTYEDLASWLKRAWAGGVNRQVLHGSAYSGVSEIPYTHSMMGFLPFGDVWPGFRPFVGVATNEWNRNTSNEMASDYITCFSRINYVMQKEQQIDVAIFYDTYEDYYRTSGGDGNDRYPDGGVLNAKGFSYEFVSAETLNLPTAVVTNDVLNEEGPAYKAIVIHNQDTISYETLQKLNALARSGLAIVFVGTTPNTVKYYSEVRAGRTDSQITNLVASMNQLANVVTVTDYADVPSALAGLGITADATYAKSADVLAKHMKDADGDYYYLYNYNKASAFDANTTGDTEGTVYPNINKDALKAETITVTLQGTGHPYEMNAWSGEIVPIADYMVGDGTVTVTVDLDKDEAKIIAILPESTAKDNGLLYADVHSENASVNMAYLGNRLIAKVTDTNAANVTTSAGATVSVKVPAVQSSFDIGAWDLKINSISQGDTIYFRDSAWNTIDVGTITELKGWMSLDESLKDVAGVGTYTATFSLDEGWRQDAGAYIDIGEVEDIYTITVNGKKLPMTNQISTKIDIGEYVVAGTNTVVVKVASPLYNYAKSVGAIGTDLLSMIGVKNDQHELIENGLLGSNGVVTVTPYKIVSIDPEPLPFTDVYLQDWYYDAILDVYFDEIMGGTNQGNTAFSPTQITDRAMAATVLWRMGSSPEVDSALTFTDIVTDTWYTEAVRWAAANGIVAGYSDKRFGPNDPITREQLATMLYSYTAYKGLDVTFETGDLSCFTDAGQISSWAANAMNWAVSQGIISGKSKTVLDPRGHATRAELATMIARFNNWRGMS